MQIQYKFSRLLPPRSTSRRLQRFDLGLQLLDRAVCRFQVLVEAVALGNEVLLPLAEAALLELHLVGELAPERVFLLLEARVVELLHLALTELARLHLGLTVVFIVLLFGAGDQIKHVRADKQRTQLLEVTVVLVLDLRNTPGVLTATDDTAVERAHVLVAANHTERHARHERTSVLGTRLVDRVERRRKHMDVVNPDHLAHALLEDVQVARHHRVGLGDDGDEVHARRETLHHLDVKWLQRVARRRNKVQARMHTHVGPLLAQRLLFLAHVSLVLVVEEVDKRHPAVAVVHVVRESRRVDHGQVHAELLLLELGLNHVDLHGARQLLRVALRLILRGSELRTEQRVDYCISCAHIRVVLPVPLSPTTIRVKLAPALDAIL